MSLDYTTSWIGLIGLTIEIVGLWFLFSELWASKKHDHKADALTSFRQGIESGMLDLQITTHKSFRDITKLMGQVISLHGKSDVTHAEVELIARKIISAADSLASDVEINNLRAQQMTGAAGVIDVFERQSETAKKLRRTAAKGIGFVLLGALLQLLDLTFF